MAEIRELWFSRRPCSSCRRRAKVEVVHAGRVLERRCPDHDRARREARAAMLRAAVRTL